MTVSLQISEIEIQLVKPNNGLVGFASCVLNGAIYLSSIAIYSKLDGSGYRILFPTRKFLNGTQINYFHPITREAGEIFKNSILKKVEELFANTPVLE